MLWPFRKFAERIKALLLTDAALGLEAEFLARQVERKAELFQKAQEYEEQGLGELAEELRGQALALSTASPLASLLPTISNLNDDMPETERTNIENQAMKMAGRLPPASKTRAAKKTLKTKAR